MKRNSWIISVIGIIILEILVGGISYLIGNNIAKSIKQGDNMKTEVTQRVLDGGGDMAVADSSEIINRISGLDNIKAWTFEAAKWASQEPVTYKIYISMENSSVTFRRESIEELIADIDYFEEKRNE